MDRVIFLEIEEEIVAVFPDIRADLDGNVLSYVHVGQHGGCDPEHIFTKRQASFKEYEPLLNELIQLGYNPHVIKPDEVKSFFKPLKKQ